MKAQVLHSIGDLRYSDVPGPAPGPGEVLVEVRAAGICGSDVPRVYNTGAHNMPLIPGHEFSGVVYSVGESVDTSWAGKRVGIFPLIPCMSCQQCKQGHYELCRHYDYVGSRRDGAFAELVAVPAANLIELPEAVSFEEAAMLEPMAVAVHAMRRGFAAAGMRDIMGSAKEPAAGKLSDGASADRTVAVIGVGTIGLLLAMFLKDAGVRDLYLIGNKDSQRKRAALIGVDGGHFCDSTKIDAPSWLKGQTDGGASLVFECVGKSLTCAMAVECAAPMSAVLFMGNPYGDMTFPRNTFWKILRDQLTVTGTWNSSFDITKDPARPGAGERADMVTSPDDWRYVIGRLEAGAVHPASLITHRLQLSELERGLKIMRDKTEDYCKVMILPISG